MAKLSHAASRRMYSWWWDSHISPKNSKWLQENLTDTDAKVKSMIKLIEQDADSFARRAEMYYEKRPELMKMVEEFYRAYRALAERYDHATGALRQAHRTLTQPFPNENDELASDATENDPQTPDDDSIGSGDDLKFGEQKMNRGINFNEVEEKDRKLEMEIETLRKVLAKFEVEKESSLAQYKQSLENLSHQEFEFSNAKEDSKALAERANKTEDEVKSLRKALKALEVEKEKSLVQYQKCREKIEKDAFDLNERAHKAETEAQILKLDLAKMESEKEQFLEKIFDLGNMLELAEDDSKELNKRNEEAEIKVETLKQALVELGVEKEATTAESKQCLDTISSLELKLSSSQEKVQILNSELESEVAKLKGAQEQGLNLEKLNQSLHLELKTLKLEMGAQSDELTQKKREMDILRTSAQEEKLSLAETEAAVQALQLVNAEAEEQLYSLSLELQNRSLIISNLETRNQSLLNESLKIKDENENLNELYSASSVSINDMKREILSLGDAKEKLEKEVGLQLEQRSALQQEKSRLQEELNDHNKMYLAILDQVEAVGFSSDCFQSAVKDLQDENLNLKETQEREIREKVDLLKKLENLEKVIQEKAVLDKSLLDLSADLERAREEIIAREKSFQSLSEEKSILHSEKDSLETQLHVTTENMEKLREKNIIMENSISEAHNAIEGLMMRIKIMEDSYRFLENEKSDLINKKDTLVSQVEITRRTLQDIEKKYHELEEKHSVLEKEKESTQCEVEELQLMVKEGKLKAAKQIIEKDNLHGKVFDMQKTSVTLQEENLKLIDEKISLVKDFLDFQENHDSSIEFLKEKVSTMEGENGGIRAQLAAYVPAISSLKDCISSLENSTCFYMQLGNNDDEKVKAANESHAECHEESSVDQKETVKLSELQDLEARIKAVEKTIIEKNSKLEAATRQIEKLMSNGALSQDNSKPLAVNSESQNRIMTKDIMLDQISDCYSQGIESVYSIAKLNRKGNITTQPKEGVHFNLGVIVEKELGVDKLASENRFSLPKQEVDKTKILERLKTDSQKLIDLQITVQDLKKKLEISENCIEGKSFGECERIGWHLGKSEEDIMLLSDLNGKLLINVDKSDDERDVVESEQARKVSERIGQLQLEVNEIQSIMLKLDGENGEEKIKRKTEITEAKKRTSVRNYLGLRTSNRKKKRSFCGFVYPPTTKD